MAKKNPRQKSTFLKEKYCNKDNDFIIGNKFNGSNNMDEKRITKRKEDTISLLDEFDKESNIIKMQIRKINSDLIANEKVLKKNIDELTIVQAELNRRKKQLNTIVKISNNYIEMVCEVFNVKKEHIKKIRNEKR